MTVTMLIEELQEIQKSYPDAQVKMHHADGTPVMFAVTGVRVAVAGSRKVKQVVWLEGRGDFNALNELKAQYEHAADIMMDELDFFTDMVNRGFTLDDFKAALNVENYEYAKTLMEEHGLI